MALCVVRKLPEDKKQRPLQNGDFLKETLIDLFSLGFQHFFNMFGQPIQPVAELRTSEETSHRCQSPTLKVNMFSFSLCLCLKTLKSKVVHLVSEWQGHLWSCLWQLKRLKRRLWLNLCFLFPVNHRNNIVHRRGNYLIINSPKNHHTFIFMLQNGNIYPNDEKIQLRKWGWWLNWNLWRKAQKLWNGF